MKYLIMFIFLPCLFQTELSSQRMWGSYEGSIGGTLYGALIECGDTTIDGKSYIRLEKYTWNPDKGTLPFRNGDRFIRREGAKVYRWTISGDILLYDYSLESGDTVDYSIRRIENRFEITLVDSIDLLGKMRKRIKLRGIENKQHDEWIEGYGSTYNNYLKPGELPIIGNGGSWSVCLMDTKTGEYWHRQNDSLPCLLEDHELSCQTSTSTIEAQVKALRVFPNPIQRGRDKIQIDGVEGTEEIVLIMPDGSRAIRTTISKLNVEVLFPGIYLIKIIDESRERIGKLVVR